MIPASVCGYSMVFTGGLYRWSLPVVFTGNSLGLYQNLIAAGT